MWDLLSPREKQIVELMAKGYRAKDIAVEFNSSLGTVTRQISSLRNKLGLNGDNVVSMLLKFYRLEKLPTKGELDDTRANSKS